MLIARRALPSSVIDDKMAKQTDQTDFSEPEKKPKGVETESTSGEDNLS